ncbi:MAG: LysR substrate-binding domain-containing protein [Arenibacterium sp.]
MKFSFRQLEAFRAVAETGSITRAAGRLGISQPATSRLLADFSKAIDIDLFNRRGGNLFPTSEAKYMLAETNRVFEGLNNLEDLRQNLKRRTTGYLRIACLPGFATSHLPGVLARFLQERPGVTVTLEPDRPERILEWIIGEQYDCGITDGFAGHQAIKSTDILIRSVCILPKGHHLEQNSEITPRDLRNEKLIHSRRDSPFFRRLSDAFEAYEEQMISWVEVRQFTTACTIVAQGHGVSIVSALDAEQYRDQGLVIRPFLPSVPHRLSLLSPIRGSQSPVATDFLETFAQSLSPFRVSEAPSAVS